ncbi:MAG: hypothetical protein IKJ27_10520 [Clostridia bacterium]|nr:hypothetical protein [Clostridia bacterium]
MDDMSKLKLEQQTSMETNSEKMILSNTQQLEKPDNTFDIISVADADELFCLSVDSDGKEAAEEVLDKIMKSLSEENKLIEGLADDFHNFSVSILRQYNNYRTALQIVELGLKNYEENTDLLADAIRYGSCCGKTNKCKEWLSVLLKIDRTKWTWRAFSFSIEFLLSQYLSYSGKDIESIIALTKEYQTYFPNDEDGWRREQEIYSKTNHYQKSILVLEEAINRFKFCPRCWLRYADLMMDEGEYEKAAPIIEKLRRNPLSMDSVNISYVYYLDGLCKMTKLKHSIDYTNNIFNEEAILEIYRLFYNSISHSDIKSSIKVKIKDQVKSLEIETNIYCPYDF